MLASRQPHAVARLKSIGWPVLELQLRGRTSRLHYGSILRVYSTGLLYGFTLRVYSTGLLYGFTLRVYSTGLLYGFTFGFSTRFYYSAFAQNYCTHNFCLYIWGQLPVKLTIIKQYNLFYAAHLSLFYCDFHH
jgi:hypothetical protein